MRFFDVQLLGLDGSTLHKLALSLAVLAAVLILRYGIVGAETRIMEMGEPTSAQSDSNPSWVHARQYTGRIVSVTNDKVFDEPIYNYTHEFPFIWEELRIPVPYQSDRANAERILIECADRVTSDITNVSAEVRQEMERKYFIDLNTLKPRVFQSLTDNWLLLTLRFISRPYGVRDVKDEISRAVLDRFEAQGISVASATYDVVGFPPLKIEGAAVERIASALERNAPPLHRDERRSA
jgi:small-conductance mechanosensitive channel